MTPLNDVNNQQDSMEIHLESMLFIRVNHCVKRVSEKNHKKTILIILKIDRCCRLANFSAESFFTQSVFLDGKPGDLLAHARTGFTGIAVMHAIVNTRIDDFLHKRINAGPAPG